MSLRHFKYLVGYCFDLKQYTVAFLPDRCFHDQIAAVFPEGYKPVTGGHFSVELSGMDWHPDTVQIYGRSKGLNLDPDIRDRAMVVAHLEAENRGEELEFFDKDRQPIVWLEKAP